MSYNTGNAVPSKDPRDLSDNAEILDGYVNGSAATVQDRLGVQRKTLAGMSAQFDQSEVDRADAFQAALQSIGYSWLGDYAAGLTFTARNQYTVRSGSLYRLAPSQALPYTLTGTWATDQPKLIAFEVAGSILSQLAAATGATLVGTAEGVTVQAALDTRLKAGVDLGSTSLNSLGANSSQGLYDQATPASATLALGYPIAGVGGSLLVSQGVFGAQQQFTTSTGRIFLRSLTAAFSTDGPWAAWFEATVPRGGLAGQTLVNPGGGAAPVWASPGGSEGLRANLYVRWASTGHVVTADRLTLTSAAGNSITLSSFNQTATDGAASGAINSLDTGTWASNGEYYLHAIYNPTSDTRGLLFSLSATAPTLPAGFTHFVRVSAAIRISGAFPSAYQYGRKFYYEAPFVRNFTAGAIGSLGLTAVTWSAVSVVGVVPATAREALLQLTTAGAVGTFGSRGYIAAAPTGNYSAPYSTIPPWMTNASGNTDFSISEVVGWIPLFTRAINIAASATGPASRIMGWEDNL